MKSQKLVFIAVIILMAFRSNGQPTINVTYIANEGFILSSTSERILIDGIFTEGWGYYHVPGIATLTQERNAESPFDSINHILVTHKDADHVNASYLAEHMVNNSHAVLICSPQVNDKLNILANYSTILDRINVITPVINTKIDTTIGGMKFEVMFIQHAANLSSSIQNTPFIFTLNGIKILHAGDANSINLSDFQDLHLADDSIDIAFLPCWFLDSDAGNVGKDIISYINPKAIVLMHIDKSKYEDYKSIISGLSGLPPVFIIENQMETVSFKLKNKVVELVTEKITSIDENPESGIKIFPNPTSGSFCINPDKPINKSAEVELFSMDGRKILEYTGISSFPLMINVPGHARGIFIVKIYLDGKWYTQKIGLQ